MSSYHVGLLDKLCSDLGYIKSEFIRGAVALAIDDLVKEIYHFEPDSEEGRYRRLYGFWIAKCGLPPNRPRQTIDTELSESVLSKYGYDRTIMSMKIYSRVLYDTEYYAFVPDKIHMELFLSQYIETFLSTTTPSPLNKYRKPRLSCKPEILKEEPVICRLSEEQRKEFAEINRRRKEKGRRPLTLIGFKKQKGIKILE